MALPQGTDPITALPDRIGCRGCGRWFVASDGPAMLAAIKGRCPDCGGSFVLLDRQLDSAERDA